MLNVENTMNSRIVNPSNLKGVGTTFSKAVY